MEAGNQKLIEHLIREGYLKTERVIEAFRNVPRRLFVPDELRRNAYDDCPLPIGREGRGAAETGVSALAERGAFGRGGRQYQTISAPHMVAMMTELLGPRPGDKVLEIGAGSGYQAAILSKLVKKVYAIELERQLADFAKENIRRAGITNVEIMQGDGSKGYAKAAPYDKIIISCACERVPYALFRQLKVGGVLIAPVGGPWFQELKLFRKTKSGVEEENHGGCVFVPMRRKQP